MLALVMMGLKD